MGTFHVWISWCWPWVPGAILCLSARWCPRIYEPPPHIYRYIYQYISVQVLQNCKCKHYQLHLRFQLFRMRHQKDDQWKTLHGRAPKWMTRLRHAADQSTLKRQTPQVQDQKATRQVQINNKASNTNTQAHTQHINIQTPKPQIKTKNSNIASTHKHIKQQQSTTNNNIKQIKHMKQHTINNKHQTPKLNT